MLLIDDVALEDAGLYQCIGRNAYGNASVTLRLDVTSTRRTIGSLSSSFDLSTAFTDSSTEATQTYTATVSVLHRNDTRHSEDVSLSYKLLIAGVCAMSIACCTLAIVTIVCFARCRRINAERKLPQTNTTCNGSLLYDSVRASPADFRRYSEVSTRSADRQLIDTVLAVRFIV